VGILEKSVSMPLNHANRSHSEAPSGEIGMLAAVFEAVPFPMAALDALGVIVVANRSFRQEWLGSEQAEPVSLQSIAHVDDRALVGDEITRALDRAATSAGDYRNTIEFRVPGRTDVRWVSAMFVGTAGTGSATPVSVFLSDVTTLRQCLTEISERESRWNNALISSESGVWDHNWTTGQKYYSPTWRKIRGMSENDPLPASTQAWLDLLHPEDREHVLHCIARQNAGDPAYTVFHYRERHKDGHWVWIECRGACIEWDANGVATRLVGTDTDITERKAAEEAAANLARRLEMALDISGIGVFEADFDTGQVEWDEPMRAIYQVDSQPQVEIGGLWERFLHPDDTERVHAKVRDNLRKGERFSDEYRIILGDGSERVIRSRTMPYTDEHGHQKMVGANWDVTSDVSLHQELQRAKTLAEARNRELEAARSRIEHNAMHDYLTGLPNRRYLDDMLDRVTRDSDRAAQGLAILHIDLDRFKQINDTLGHNAGDAILKHVSRTLKNAIRKGEFVARIGGDEFVVVSKFQGSARRLANLADRIIAELRTPVSYEGHDCRFGASIGIACQSGPIVDGRQLLLNADIALYRAKNLGRNRYEFFSVETHHEMISAKKVSDEILLAIERREFVPFYQLQFDAATLDIVGVETLARWKHPTLGILTPDRFLPLAEELNVVAVIDSLILDAALVDFEDWQRQAVGIPKLSVNVSYRRLHDTDLIKTLKARKIKPGTVSFELLESIFFDDCDDAVMTNLRQLKKLGIDIEIDDFGTGHASIIGLLRLSPLALKIDRQLVRPISQSHEQRRLVSAMIDIGRTLDIRVVAEGVETADHVRILRELGCNTLQGFALARPKPREEIPTFVKAARWRDLLEKSGGKAPRSEF
jgi:diguanylate cyclase (GGDEF)-like protein/PAS domain S-box-containing protein